MTRKLRWLSGCVVAAGLAWPATVQAAGPILRCIDNCASIPYGVQPAPPGTYIKRYRDVQAGIAEQDDFVIYRHMWYRGGRELGPLGLYQLDMMTRRLGEVPFPVVIETSKNDTLDEDRRNVIVQLLQARGLADPTRVIVAYPIAEGLYGEEGYLIYRQLLFGGFGYGGIGGFGFGGGFGGFGGFGGGFGGFGGGF